MSDMTDEESKAYFDGRDEGFNDAKEVIKELRTRVASLEKKVQDQKDFKRMFTDVAIESLDKENKELQNRLSTLEAENNTLKGQLKHTVQMAIMPKGFEKKAEEIQSLETRLSTLEQSILDLSHPNIKNILSELNQYKSKTVNVVAFHKLEDRLSTLLKASEGLEKALELVLKRGTQVQNSDQYMFEVLKQSESALADFRAVKEGL